MRAVFVATLTFGLAACGGAVFDTHGGTGGNDAGTGAGGDAGGSGTGGATGQGGGAGGAVVGAGGSGNGGTFGAGGTVGAGGVRTGAGGVVTGAGGSGTGGSGGAPNIDSCSQPTDCMLVNSTCCGGCEPANDQTFVAVNRKMYGMTPSRCAAVECAACPPLLWPNTNTSQYYVPTCQSGKCTVVDIRKTPLTECQSTSDCVLRVGANCCQGCGGEKIVALNSKASLMGLVCGADPVACPACAPVLPPGFTAQCSSGRCVVNEPPCTMSHPCPL